MKKLTKYGFFAAAVLLAVGIWAMPSVAGSGRDCDGNAVLYCGALTKTELNEKISQGTSGSNQSAAELTSLFKRFGYTTADSSLLKEGRVTKSGLVYVGDKVIERDVFSMGRHKTVGSTQVSGLSYPLYLRHPSQSFLSSSIDAYVLLNYDGSFRVAIIKSCGNIVPGKIKNLNLEVQKYNDLNQNKVKDSNEPFLANWEFHITGPSLDKTLKTNSSGSIKLTDLKAGTYHITETMQDGWVASTSASKTITLSEPKVVQFGNYRKPVEKTSSLEVQKYYDLNQNNKKESNEEFLSNWQFCVVGPNTNTTLKTDSNGRFVVNNLKPGTYTVTETMQSGWIASAGLTKSVVITNTNQVVQFGNYKKPVEKTVQLKIIKFNDINGDKTEGEGENRLAGWQFKVSGPKFDKTVTTDEDGSTEITGLAEGTYTVTEINQPGWENTTGLSITKAVTAEPETQTFLFGNRKPEVVPPPTPTPPGGETLPVSGPAETAGVMAASFAATGGILSWVRSKKMLSKAFRK